LSDVDCPRPQGVVKGAVEVATNQDVDAGADDDECEHDGYRRGEDRAGSERAWHYRSTKPIPRTVWISGGSPSFRRR
jgi:hypothetical protein